MIVSVYDRDPAILILTLIVADLVSCDGKVDCSDESDEFDCPEEEVTTIEPEVGIYDPTSDYDYFDPNAGAVVTPNDTSVNYDYYLPDDYEEREYDNWYN